MKQVFLKGSLLNRVTCVPVWSTCQKRGNFLFLPTNVPKAFQSFNLASQPAKGVPNFQLGVPACQKACQFFNFACQKAYQFFNDFSKEFFNFSIMLNICKFQEYLGSSRKFISQNKEFKFDICKISLRRNLISVKPLTSFSMEHM